MNTHLHWLVYAHEGKQQVPMQGEQYREVVSLDLMAVTQGEALEKAEGIIPGKQFYEAIRVTEHEEHTEK